VDFDNENMHSQEYNFRVGDLVRMPSGGPLMQVRAVRPTLVQCSWQAGEAVYLAYFRASLIEPADSQNSPPE
jgi:uncharacterized protein YodC (DUF2158 family)